MNHQTEHVAGVRHRIEEYLSESGFAARGAQVVPLTGDASDRRYFRVSLSDGESLVLAVHAGPIEFATLPFGRVAELFGRVPLPIPAILGHSDALGVLALEDLGDVTLQAHMGAATPVERAARYREAVGLIHLLQERGAELASDRYLPYRVAFDADKFTWELGFFVRHFMEAYRGLALSGVERHALDVEWSAMANDLASEPRRLCHRDYHSRNLMLHRGRLHLIDFQDARLGPDTYDLASLLRDSYVDVTDAEVDGLVAYFLELKGEREVDRFRCRFDLMALQRNLKALGTFGYQTTARGNPVYIQYIPRTLRSARVGLEKYPRFARLREILGACIDAPA